MKAPKTIRPATMNALTSKAASHFSPRAFHAQQEEQKENKTGLPDKLKAGIENLSGVSLDDVKVHYNSDKPAHLQAHAYAQGNDIHLASGQEKHLPHEAWHVVQQKQGRVQPTLQMKNHVNINDDKGLEKEADVMGGKALRENHDMKKRKKPKLGNSPVQRNTKLKEDDKRASSTSQKTRDRQTVKRKRKATDKVIQQKSVEITKPALANAQTPNASSHFLPHLFHVPHGHQQKEKKESGVEYKRKMEGGEIVSNERGLEQESKSFSLNVAQLLMDASISSQTESSLLKSNNENNKIVQRYLSFLGQLVSIVVNGLPYAANIYSIYKTVTSYSDKFFGIVSAYHATKSDKLDSIESQGLLPSMGGKPGGAADLLGAENRDDYIQASADKVFITTKQKTAEWYKKEYEKKKIKAEILEIKLPIGIFKDAFKKDQHSLEKSYSSSTKVEPTYIVAPSAYGWMKKLKLYCTNFDFNLLLRLVKNELEPKELDHVIAYFSVLVDFIIWYFKGPMAGLISLGVGIAVSKRRQVMRERAK